MENMGEILLIIQILSSIDILDVKWYLHSGRDPLLFSQITAAETFFFFLAISPKTAFVLMENC